MYIFHFLDPAGYLKERLIYNTMLQLFYWPHIANDVFYKALVKLRSIALNASQVQPKQMLQLILAVRPLEIVTIDISGAVLRIEVGDQHIV